MRTYDPPLYLISIKKSNGWNGSQGTNDPLEAERLFAAAVARAADIGFERRCALTLRGERHRYAVPTAIKLELRGRVVAEATIAQDLDRLPFPDSQWPDLGEDRGLLAPGHCIQEDTDMPDHTDEGTMSPYAWDSPEAAWNGLVTQSVEEFFTAGAEYAGTVEGELRAYLDYYRQPGDMLDGMSEDERDEATTLMAQYALANLSPETIAVRGWIQAD